MGWVGSSGYRPDKGTMGDMFDNLYQGTGGNDYFGGSYTYNGKPIDKKTYDSMKARGFKNLGTGQSQYQQDKPQFSYSPGESGYNAMTGGGTYTPYGSTQGGGARVGIPEKGGSFGGGFLGKAGNGFVNDARNKMNNAQGSGNSMQATNPATDFGAKSYNTFQYSPIDYEEKVSPYYQGLESSASEGMKAALGQSMDSNRSGMGSRGMLGSGLQNEQSGNLALQAGQGLVDSLRNIRMDKAKSLTDIARDQQQMRMQQEGLQAGENQFASNFGEGQRQYNMGFGENQRQFGANYGQQQAMNNLQQMLAQYEMDKGMRGEKYNYWKDPYNDMLAMYSGSLGAAGKDQQGWMPGLGKAMF